jgi:hypothetical protein
MAEEGAEASIAGVLEEGTEYSGAIVKEAA